MELIGVSWKMLYNIDYMDEIKDPFNKYHKASHDKILKWSKDVFLFCDEMLDMLPAEPLDELKGKTIKYENTYGEKKEALLFDTGGRLVWHDLSFYSKDMFKWQERKEFNAHPNMFTWQQTVELEAYDRGINTFDKDSYDPRARRITIRSGHGIGKTSFASVVSIHFLWCFYFAQIGATANTDTQLKEIFLKEFYWWKKRLPEQVQDQLEELNDKIQIKGSKKNWFLRARVAGKDNPEALAGLHGNYVMLYPDEASGIWDKVYETMQGSLTGENWIVILTSNPTRTEGYFYDTHKKMNSHMWTQLHFDSRDSPIVKDDFVQGIIDQYGEHGDEFKVRVKGEFANEGEMDDKGWIPLFANMNILFEEAGQQIIKGAVIGVDPAGQGKDRSIITVRDNIYLKEVLNESTSSEPDLARKVETIVGAYSSTLNDVGIDAFGIGAKVINHIYTKIGEMPNALLCDKPREEVKDQYNSYKAELAWKFRQWVAQGGIIVTNNEKEWLRELSLIKYKRDLQGRIKLMSKVEFKKEHGFSPDRFDSCCYTFFRDEPTRPVILTKEEIENKDWADYIKRMQGGNATSMRDLSSM